MKTLCGRLELAGESACPTSAPSGAGAFACQPNGPGVFNGVGDFSADDRIQPCPEQRRESNTALTIASEDQCAGTGLPGRRETVASAFRHGHVPSRSEILDPYLSRPTPSEREGQPLSIRRYSGLGVI